MLRWATIFLFTFLLGCSSRSRSFEEILPASTGEWTRGPVSSVEPSAAPELVRQLGLKRAAAATYAGPSPVSIRIYEMNVPTSAFELIQKWRQQDGRAVYSGPYFVVANAAAGPEAASLLEALRKELK
jgi:hypothetical protein